MQATTASLKDIPELCELLNSLFAQEAEFIPDQAAQAAGLEAVISNPEVGDILVTRKDGTITGMVNLLYTVSTALGERVALLEDMVISPCIRGQGVGSELIKQTVDFAKGKGCKRITLLTDDDNSGAHRFYETHGFSRSSMVAFRMLLD